MELLNDVFHDLRPTEYIEVRLINSARSARTHFFSSIDELEKFVATAPPDCHVYFGVAPRNVRASTREAVSRVTTLWADVDAKNFGDGKTGAFRAATSFIVPPSYIVDSGNGFHVYWLLDADESPDDVETVMKVIKNIVQGDTVWDAARIMRVPGTANIKNNPPVQSRVILGRPDLRYSLQDIFNATKTSESIRQKILTGDTTGFKSRSERDWAIIRELKGFGLSDALIKVIYREQPTGDKFREDAKGEQYLEHTLERVRDHVDKPTVEMQFVEKDGCMWISTSKGMKQVSTFTIDPQRLLVGEIEDTLAVDITASGFTWKGVSLPKKAFAKRDALLKVLGVAAWQWMGDDNSVRFLLPWLMDRLREKGLPKAKATNVIGRHGEYWVFPKGTMTRTQMFDNNTSPIVYLDTHREAPEVSYDADGDDAEYDALAKQVFPRIFSINDPIVIWPVLSWAFAAPYKALMEELEIRFPVLNLYGTRGSGKTATLLRIVQPLMGYSSPQTWDCNTTAFVMLSILCSTNGVPVSLSEFRRSGLSDQQFRKILRTVLLAYDHGADARGHADQTTEKYKLSAPITLDGEDSIGDAAAKERTIMVNFRPEAIREGSSAWQAFQEISVLPLQKLAGRYIRFTLGQDAKSIKAVWETMYELSKRAITITIPDRVRRNITTCLVGAWSMRTYLEQHGVLLPVIDEEFVSAIFVPALSEVVNMITGRTSITADEMVIDIVNAIATPGVPTPFIWKYEPEPNILWIHLSSVLPWWFAKRRREGLMVLESAAIKAQMNERSMELSGGPGQYLVDKKVHLIDGASKWLYGVSLEACVESGMDIPDRLPNNQRIIINVPSSFVPEVNVN